MTTTDQIKKNVLLRAPHQKVWDALTDSKQFGSWFGMKIDGPFTPGETRKAIIVPTTVDPEVAEGQKQYEGIEFDLMIQEVKPQSLFSFRWHPYAIDPDVDYTLQPSTLVEFKLEPQSEGILLTVIESGFDEIPLDRRAKAFSSNESGWTIQMTLIEKYLA